MLRYTVQLFGITVFALATIWFVGSGEAVQTSSTEEPVLWADTVHINIGAGSAEQDEQRQKRDTFLRDVKKLTQTAFNIKNQYMEEVDTEEILKAGIRGMLADLDRFSVLMEKSSYDALMESTHGKYEGLGMQIDARDDRIRIIAPIEGTPAYRKGLRAGDIVWEIEGLFRTCGYLAFEPAIASPIDCNCSAVNSTVPAAAFSFACSAFRAPQSTCVMPG